MHIRCGSQDQEKEEEEEEEEEEEALRAGCTVRHAFLCSVSRHQAASSCCSNTPIHTEQPIREMDGGQVARGSLLWKSHR